MYVCVYVVIIAGDFNCDIRSLDGCDNMDAFLKFLNVNNFQYCISGYVGNINYTFHCENWNAKSFVDHIIVPKSYYDISVDALNDVINRSDHLVIKCCIAHDCLLIRK